MDPQCAPAGLILVIDDDVDLRDSYRALLESQSYRIATASNGEEGLKAVRELRPDAVLLDMMMPECDGLEFLRRLPGECPAPLPQVIASSGFDLLEREALALGASVFLRKPIELLEFLSVLRNLLAGQKPEPALLARQGEQTRTARQRASARREALWARLDRTDPELRARLAALVLRLSQYFDATTALVTLVKDGEIFVLASSGGIIPAGTLLQHEASFHADVVVGGSSLVLRDAASHACFADHPGARSEDRFFACAPLTGNDRVPIGTLSLQDPRPRQFHAEDLLILEHLALGVARRIEARAGVGMVGPYAFDEPGVFTRESLLVLLGAELGRASRHGGAVELALLELEAEGSASVQQAALAAYGAAGGERFAIATYGAGVLALVRGAGDPAVADQRINQALIDLRVAGVGVRGVGRVTCALASSAAMGALGVLQLADEARVRSVTTGSGVEHVVLGQRS